jgi:hypothetical protein
VVRPWSVCPPRTARILKKYLLLLKPEEKMNDNRLEGYFRIKCLDNSKTDSLNFIRNQLDKVDDPAAIIII